jgi:hypothetical protein
MAKKNVVATDEGEAVAVEPKPVKVPQLTDDEILWLRRNILV